jgi:hypothetical protein
MLSDTERSLRDYAEHLRTSTRPIDAAEVYTRLGAGHAEPTSRARRRPVPPWVRWSAVAATVTVIAGAGAVLIRGDESPGSITTPTGSSGVESSPTMAASTTPDPSVVASAPTPAPTTAATPAVDPEPPVSIADVHEAQRTALRRLPGFSATATPGNDRGRGPVRYTLLADGSFYADTGGGTFGSYDPSTKSSLGAYRDADGELSYQEIVGQSDNSLPLSILGGFDPTRLAGDGTTMQDVAVRELDVEGRPSWEITVADTYPRFSRTPDTVVGDDITQTTVQVVDQETGLIVRSEISSTDPAQPPQSTTLTDIEIADEMPPGFPDVIPADAVVDRSGDPAAARASTLEDLPSFFARPVPAPVGLLNGQVMAVTSSSISIGQMDMFGEHERPEDGAAVVERRAEFVVREGFVATTVSVSAQAVRAGGEPWPGMATIDGYQCPDLDLDGVCDPPDTQPGADSFAVTDGALAGVEAIISASPTGAMAYAGVQLGPFQIFVMGGDLAATQEILNTFESITGP